MRGLDGLVRAGKVLYIGISDTPAWIVSRANMLAELRGWSQFVGLQVRYSLLDRAGERDLLPMARALAALIPLRARLFQVILGCMLFIQIFGSPQLTLEGRATGTHGVTACAHRGATSLLLSARASCGCHRESVGCATGRTARRH